MKSIVALLAALLFAQVTLFRAAAETPSALADVQSADDARVAAMKSADASKLGAIFSDDLRYTHSSGAVDSRASLREALTSGKLKYVSIDYEKREFSLAAPTIALMTGRAHIQAATANGTMDGVLSFLAVWRLESGHWRFLAWQSAKLPAGSKP